LKLCRLDIKNFRGIKDLSLALDDVTVLIGDNNTGKTSILAALQLCLSRSMNRKTGVFGDYDYHFSTANTQPSDADPIEITLHFAEEAPEEWTEQVPQLLTDAISIGEDDRQSVSIRVTSTFDPESGGFLTQWVFLNPAGNVLTKASNPRNFAGLQQLVPVFYLAALRDAAQEFRARSQFWGPFVRSLKMDAGIREGIEADLAELNQRVLDSHEAFGPVRERLKNTGKLLPLGGDDPVGIEAIPGKVFDMLSRTQVLLSGKTGARLPIGHHGEGTQSLAVICLFDAFLQSQLEEAYSAQAHPILALEEPEAHLHPSAVRAVGKLLCELRGQKIVATHSGDLVASVPVTALRRLCRKNGNLVVHRVAPGALTQEEQRKLDHYVRLSRGNLLFARFWILVEGETDAFLLQELARLSGIDLWSAGVCCVEYSVVGVEKLIKLADQLGIGWCVLADNDGEGKQYIASAKEQLSGRDETAFLRLLPHGDIETFFCVEGFGDIYVATVSPQKLAQTPITAATGTVDYWASVVALQPKKGKPMRAASIIEEIEKNNKQLPAFIKSLLDHAVAQSKEAS
jgi:putative ATP-dependent endonuclease of OLD family